MTPRVDRRGSQQRTAQWLQAHSARGHAGRDQGRAQAMGGREEGCSAGASEATEACRRSHLVYISLCASPKRAAGTPPPALALSPASRERHPSAPKCAPTARALTRSRTPTGRPPHAHHTQWAGVRRPLQQLLLRLPSATAGGRVHSLQRPQTLSRETAGTRRRQSAALQPSEEGEGLQRQPMRARRFQPHR
jgi:hypothetical protein